MLVAHVSAHLFALQLLTLLLGCGQFAAAGGADDELNFTSGSSASRTIVVSPSQQPEEEGQSSLSPTIAVGGTMPLEPSSSLSPSPSASLRSTVTVTTSATDESTSTVTASLLLTATFTAVQSQSRSTTQQQMETATTTTTEAEGTTVVDQTANATEDQNVTTAAEASTQVDGGAVYILRLSGSAFASMFDDGIQVAALIAALRLDLARLFGLAGSPDSALTVTSMRVTDTTSGTVSAQFSVNEWNQYIAEADVLAVALRSSSWLTEVAKIHTFPITVLSLVNVDSTTVPPTTANATLPAGQQTGSGSSSSSCGGACISGIVVGVIVVGIVAVGIAWQAGAFHRCQKDGSSSSSEAKSVSPAGVEMTPRGGREPISTDDDEEEKFGRRPVFSEVAPPPPTAVHQQHQQRMMQLVAPSWMGQQTFPPHTSQRFTVKPQQQHRGAAVAQQLGPQWLQHTGPSYQAAPFYATAPQQYQQHQVASGAPSWMMMAPQQQQQHRHYPYA